MSRKPADKLRPNQSRQAIWDIIRAQNGAEFTACTIEMVIHLQQSSIRDYLAGLIKAGFLESMPSGERFQAVKYRLIRDNGIEAPRVRKDGSLVTQGMSREQMWRSLWIFAQKGRPFTYRDLTLFASIDSSPVSESDAKSYCYYLHKSGYLVEVQAGGPGKLIVYRMPIKRWTGPKPVEVQRTKRCFDPNTGTVAHQEITSVEGGE